MEIDLNELERRANAATPGKWTWKQVGSFNTPGCAVFWPDTSKGGVHYRRLDSGRGMLEADANFVAAANPAVVLELVRRLREAEHRVAELEAELSDDHWPHGATVKLRRVGLGYFEKHGWAKRDSEGQLITVCSGASLDESMWEVVQELKVQPAKGRDCTKGEQQ